MKQTHFIKILKELDVKELKRFEEWINSPFFNKNEKLKKLYRVILEYAPNFDHSQFTKETVYKATLGDIPFTATRFNNILSDLLQLLFQYLAHENYQNTSEFEKLCLMNELFKRGLTNSMLKVGKRFQKVRQQNPIQNSSTFFDNYLYYKQMDEYRLTEPTRDFDNNLQAKNDELDLFYLATKLKIACDMASRNLVVQGNYECHFIENLIAELNFNVEKYKSYPAISVYFNVLQTMQNEENETHYNELKTLLADNLSAFPKEELRILYDYVRNYCIRKINQGNANYYQEILTLYQFLLDKKIIFKNGFLTQWDYKNIVTVGVRLGELDWTEQFIHQYKTMLPPKEQENAYIYNLAAFHFEAKHYKKSLLLLHEVRFTDSSYYIGAKIIQLKSYYELEESDAFYALIEAFRIYLLRNKTLSDYRKRANLNFLKLAQKVFKLKENEYIIGKKAFAEKLNKLKSQVANTSPLVNKQWLVDNLNFHYL